MGRAVGLCAGGMDHEGRSAGLEGTPCPVRVVLPFLQEVLPL